MKYLRPMEDGLIVCVCVCARACAIEISGTCDSCWPLGPFLAVFVRRFTFRY